MRLHRTSLITLSALGAMVVASFAVTTTAEARGAKPALARAHLRPGYVGAQGYAGGPPGPRTPMLVDPGHGFLIGVGIPATIQAALR